MTENQRHWIRILLALAIAVAIAYALLAIAREDESHSQIMIMLPPSKWDEKMLELDRRALEEAYTAKIRQLFDVWVREGLSSPEGPAKGHAQAQRAFIASMTALEERERLQNERK